MSHPETAEAAVEAPKKRRGRPRKRHDEAPFVAPVDGEWNNSVVLGKNPGKHYAYIDQESEDLGRLRSKGVIMTETDRASGVVSPYDSHTEGPIKMGNLVLMECPIEMHQRGEDRNRRDFASRFNAEREKVGRHVAANPGSEYKVEQV
jgi:hypothetical protein